MAIVPTHYGPGEGNAGAPRNVAAWCGGNYSRSRPRLTLNARTRGGEIAARLLHLNGQPVAGFDWQDHRALVGDVLSAPLDWSGDTRQLAGETVMLELRLRRADRFGFAMVD